MKKYNKTREYIFLSAKKLFIQYGWKRITVEYICKQSAFSKVTFYKYFKNKKEILIEIFLENKNEAKKAFMAILEKNSTGEEALNELFTIQKKLFGSFYSKAILNDINHNNDQELALFFKELEQEKYDFLVYFFQTLQERKVINDGLPITFINHFIRALDQMMQEPELIKLYEQNPQKFPKDVLDVLIHGIAYYPK